MQINPSEVTKILKEQIKKFGEKAEISEVGHCVIRPQSFGTAGVLMAAFLRQKLPDRLQRK